MKHIMMLVRVILGFISIFSAIAFGWLMLVFFSIGGGEWDTQIAVYTIFLLLILGSLVFFGLRLICNKLGKLTTILGIVGFLPIVWFLVGQSINGYRFSHNDPVGMIMAGRYEQAISYYTNKIDSGDPSGYDERANIYYGLGQYENALLDFERIQDYPSIVITNVKLGNLDAAMTAAKLAPANYPLISSVLIEKKDYTGALAEYKKQLTEDKYKGKLVRYEIYFSMANILARLNRDSEAIVAYNKAIEEEKKYRQGKLRQSLRMRGNYYLTKGDYEKAIGDFSQGLSYEDSADDLRYGRILAYLLSGDFAAAQADLDFLTEQMRRTDPAIDRLQKRLDAFQGNTIERKTYGVEIKDNSALTSKTYSDMFALLHNHTLIPDYEQFIDKKIK